ncbi:superoxide dismutase [Actinomyces qiguomingii]|uniref:superoxide dismutase n=1 Tax=Actinomyces qiguomingii TaxID=2057800 RepID=UPI000CA02E18|nr:superoxide dismutase [Actinomyces qiguomingii]
MTAPTDATTPQYTLPELPYDYAALEPHISGRIMELHHDRHHAAYVTGANTALQQLAAARADGDFAAINLWEKNLAFNLGGHINHSIFWKNLSPNGGGEPEGELAQAIKDSFGSFAALKQQLNAAALGIQGSGWAVLAYDSVSGRLVTFQLFDQQGNVPVGTIPLLQIDMWEHAFYLDYLNVKADYLAAVWQVVNWEDVSQRLADAVARTEALIVR